MQQNKPFKDLKVVELASILAGPAVGMFFAELGAEVLKIENPRTKGDPTRQWKSKEETNAAIESAYFSSVNWGKKSLFLDISDATGKAELYGFLERADILLVNFKATDISKMGVDFSTLSSRFPKLICAYIFGYGENDPRPAFDLVMQAETGFMSMNGTSESGALKMPVAIIDLMAAHQLKEGILTALYLREKSNLGSKVVVSLFDSAVASLANQASNYLVTGKTPERMGSLHPNIAPYGETFETGDGKFCVLAIGTDNQFEKFCEAIGKKGLQTDPKFSKNDQRVVYRAELFNDIGEFFEKRDSKQISEILDAAGIPHSFVKTVGELLVSDLAADLILDGKTVKTAVFKIDQISLE